MKCLDFDTGLTSKRFILTSCKSYIKRSLKWLKTMIETKWRMLFFKFLSMPEWIAHFSIFQPYLIKRIKLLSPQNFKSSRHLFLWSSLQFRNLTWVTQQDWSKSISQSIKTVFAFREWQILMQVVHGQFSIRSFEFGKINYLHYKCILSENNLIKSND